MDESLSLFETIVNYQWFEKTSMIMFLNKTDLLEEKLPKSSFKAYVPGFTGTGGRAREPAPSCLRH